jgi:hypothetical protein
MSRMRFLAFLPILVVIAFVVFWHMTHTMRVALVPAVRAEVLGKTAPGIIYSTIGDMHPLDSRIPSTQAYTIKLDQDGGILWSRAEATDTLDFEKIATDRYTLDHFLNVTGRWDGYYEIFDTAFGVVRTIRAVGNPHTDVHGLAFLKNGNIIVPSYHLEEVNGKILEDYVIQEVTPDDRVVFTWKSLDHVAFSETRAIETRPYWLANHILDYFHGNSIFETKGGDLLVSGRNVSQVLLVDRRTGAVKWRLGGSKSDFTFVHDSLGGFSMQHSVSELLNGDILLYDNGNEHKPAQTRVVEYKLDLTKKTATLVWSYAIKGKFTYAGGSVQRLPDGHTFIGWGFDMDMSASSVRMTEVDVAGAPVLNVYYPAGSGLYSAFKQE